MLKPSITVATSIPDINLLGDRAAGLLLHAVLAVEALSYISDEAANYRYDDEGPEWHRPEVAHLVQVRSACDTAIVALNLCAAALARRYCAAERKEASLQSFKRLKPKDQRFPIHEARRNALPQNLLGWIDNVLSDARYTVVLNYRNRIVHSRPTRHFKMSVNSAGDDSDLTEYALVIKKIEIRMTRQQLINMSLQLAGQHVSSLVSILPGISK